MPADQAAETANIHLCVPEGECCVSVTIPPGEATVRSVLPAARQLSHEITALAVAAVEREGRTVSCRAGCGACCRQLVAISLPEAVMLAELVAAMPAPRQLQIRERFASAIRQLENAGLLAKSDPAGNRCLIHTPAAPTDSAPRQLIERYFRQQIACPFLEEESCSIHPDRPLVCREHLAITPAERCARLFDDNVEIETVRVPVRLGGVMVRLAHNIFGTSLESIPLVLALEWAENHPRALDRKLEGIELVRQLVAETEHEHRRMLGQAEVTDPAADP